MRAVNGAASSSSSRLDFEAHEKGIPCCRHRAKPTAKQCVAQRGAIVFPLRLCLRDMVTP